MKRKSCGGTTVKFCLVELDRKVLTFHGRSVSYICINYIVFLRFPTVSLLIARLVVGKLYPRIGWVRAREPTPRY